MVSWGYYQHVMEVRKKDSAYTITGVIQTGYEKEPLATSYLIELMDLSLDKPANLYAVDESHLQKRLFRSPLIKSALIYKALPNTVHVDYEARKPIAYLKDFSNTLISEDGILLPFKPFFSPKNFPDVYLGNLSNDIIYGAKIPEERMTLIRDFIAYVNDFFERHNQRIRFIDFSNSGHSNKDRAEITLFIEGAREGYDCECLMRLGSHSYKEGLALYNPIMEKEDTRILKILKGDAKKWHLIMDLRTPKMALVMP